MLKKHNRKAFTLVELIVVIVILAVLAAIAFMVLTKMIGKSRDSRRIADLSTITKSLEMFLFSPEKAVTLTLTGGASEFDTVTLTGTNIVRQGPFSNTYWTSLRNLGFDSLSKLPKDPQNIPYVISIYVPSQKDYSLGATLENQSSDTVGAMALIDGNTFNKKLSWKTTTITMHSLLFTGTYDTTNTNYTLATVPAADFGTVAAMTGALINDSNKTSRIPYALSK